MTDENKQIQNAGNPAAKNRIKNITKDVEQNGTESILPKLDWNERMMVARHTTGSNVQSVVKPVEQPVSRPLPSPTKRPLSEAFEEEEATDKQKRITPKKQVVPKKKSKPISKVAALLFVVLLIVVCFFVARKSVAATNNNGDGLRLYNNAEYEKAVASFEKALSYDEDNADIWTNLGMTFIQMQKYADALDAFEQAEAFVSDNNELQLAKRGAGIAYIQKGDFVNAIKQLEGALSVGEEGYSDVELDILYYLAEAYSKNGDVQAAIGCYTKVIDTNDAGDAYMLRGLAYYELGNYDASEADLKIAIEMHKKNYRVYLAYYDVLMDQGKTDEAKEILLSAASLGGKTGEDYANRGMIYMYMADYHNAIECFETALDKGYVEAYIGLADAYVSQNDYAQSTKVYEDYIATGKATATAYNQYGLCLMELERYEEAAHAFKEGQLLNDHSANRQLMFNEVVAYEQMRDWATAYEKISVFVERYPEDEAGLHEYTFLQTRQ